ncbi:Anamorsin-like [Heracleum sosnowskyi]|uniref:Anamorsin homolog n=1 Tax=Heracleum sosnowskyi TaxID=360622 RepID=A0AAD8IGK0_9APIA|nr:Anamorsin-like [Heracleum sosnowskyi]
MGTTTIQDSVLALTDNAVLPISAVYNAIKEIKKEGYEQSDPLIITQAASVGSLPVDPSSMDIVICICHSFEFLSEKFLVELSRVLKPGGQILLQTSQSVSEQATTSSLQKKLLVAGFVDLQTGPVTSELPSEILQSFTIKAKRPSWKVGSSFSIKKATKSLPKIQIDDDMDLIDEDSLLSEEDLKKPQMPLVGDCEVSSTRKACKNCTCGRAEAEEKVQKIGPTMDQLDNPQSACGSCGLGDAFRCGTCPYKGLPTFKLGEKVALSGNFLAADI